MFSINLQSLFDSRSISFGELRQLSRCANHLGSNRGLTRRDDNYSCPDYLKRAKYKSRFSKKWNFIQFTNPHPS